MRLSAAAVLALAAPVANAAPGGNSQGRKQAKKAAPVVVAEVVALEAKVNNGNKGGPSRGNPNKGAQGPPPAIAAKSAAKEPSSEPSKEEAFEKEELDTVKGIVETNEIVAAAEAEMVEKGLATRDEAGPLRGSHSGALGCWALITWWLQCQG